MGILKLSCKFEERKWIQDKRDIQYSILHKDVPVCVRECVCVTAICRAYRPLPVPDRGEHLTAVSRERIELLPEDLYQLCRTF
jgi:hypothetical protein